MDPDQIRQMIAALAAEEDTLLETMKKTDVRLAQIRAARASLTALESDEPIVFEGKLADGCRAVLKKNGGRSLSPLEVRDELKAIGYDFSQHEHGNVMASIHSVLKRLAKPSGDVKSKEIRDGSGTRYWWVGEQSTAPHVIGSMGPGGALRVYPDTTKLAEDSNKVMKMIESMDTTKFMAQVDQAAKDAGRLAEIVGKIDPEKILKGFKP